jgi:hypothetical protein
MAGGDAGAVCDGAGGDPIFPAIVPRVRKQSGLQDPIQVARQIGGSGEIAVLGRLGAMVQVAGMAGRDKGLVQDRAGVTARIRDHAGVVAVPVLVAEALRQEVSGRPEEVHVRRVALEPDMTLAVGPAPHVREVRASGSGDDPHPASLDLRVKALARLRVGANRRAVAMQPRGDGLARLDIRLNDVTDHLLEREVRNPIIKCDDILSKEAPPATAIGLLDSVRDGLRITRPVRRPRWSERCQCDHTAPTILALMKPAIKVAKLPCEAVGDEFGRRDHAGPRPSRFALQDGGLKPEHDDIQRSGGHNPQAKRPSRSRPQPVRTSTRDV